MSDYLRPHESQHSRPPCPSPTPGVHSDSRPLNEWKNELVKDTFNCTAAKLLRQARITTEIYRNCLVMFLFPESYSISRKEILSLEYIYASGQLKVNLLLDIFIYILPTSQYEGKAWWAKVSWDVFFKREASEWLGTDKLHDVTCISNRSLLLLCWLQTCESSEVKVAYCL